MGRFVGIKNNRRRLMVGLGTLWTGEMDSARTTTFNQMLEDFGPRLRAVAGNILCRADEADEVCQDAFLTYWRTPPRETDRGAVYSWLRRVVTNLSINRLRRRKPTGSADEREAVDYGDRGNPSHQAETTELAGICRGLIAELSPERRAAISLRVLEELSYEEIADVLGCSLGTVMSRLHRARQELIARLRKLGISDCGLRISEDKRRPCASE